jgi:hypothetical protein
MGEFGCSFREACACVNSASIPEDAEAVRGEVVSVMPILDIPSVLGGLSDSAAANRLAGFMPMETRLPVAAG